MSNALKIAAGMMGGGAPPGPTDPLFSSVSMLLNFDTDFSDAKGNTWTPVGSAAISSTKSKFGGASLRLDGSGASLTTPDFAGIAFGGGDFTVEAWVNFDDFGFYHTLLGQWGEGGNIGFGVFAKGAPNNDNYLQYSTDGSNTPYEFFSSGYPALTWIHYAITVQSGIAKMWTDGALSGSSAMDGAIFNSTANVSIGSAAGFHFKGYMDSIRVTKGVARYTANFAPPTEPFPEA